MSRRSAAWILAVIILAVTPVDDWLDRSMPRLVLVQIPAWILLGWLAGRALRGRQYAWNPHGLSGLAFFVGALGFWMIPRSIDTIGSSGLADQFMHASLLVAGAGLGLSASSLPFVARAAP